MQTLKLKIKLDNEQKLFIKKLQRQYSSLVHFTYKRFKEGLTEKAIRVRAKLLNNVELLDSWLVQSAIKEAEQLFKTKKEKVIFGGKYSFKLRAQGKIISEELKEKRLLPVCSIGEKLQMGNRKFKLEHNKIIFKLNRKVHIEIELPEKLNNNYKNILQKLQTLCELKEATVTYKLNAEYILITFDEALLKQAQTQTKNIKQNRYLAIDMNPNRIGCSIVEQNANSKKILQTVQFELSKLTVKSGEASNTKRSKHLCNKLKHETIQIAKQIIEQAQHFQCASIFIEDLNIATSNKRLGKNFNRLVNNKWLRNLLISNLQKCCNLANIKLHKVNAAYSSTIGNCQNDFTDAINSSLEVGRRGFAWFVQKRKDAFYPPLELKASLENLWKEDLAKCSSWKELHQEIKNSKLKVRVSLEEAQALHSSRVFRLNQTDKSRVTLHQFC